MELVQYDFARQLMQTFIDMLETKKKACTDKSEAASKIQAAYISFRQRMNRNAVRRAVIAIQSSYRRKVVVLKCQKIYDAIQFQKRQAFYSSMATRIQCAYRGYASRKYVLDAEERRRQIQEMALAAADQAELCRQYNDHCENMMVQEKIEKQTKVIQQLGKLHHLRSTKNHPGVFKPNYPILAPTIGGRKIDDLLKEEGIREARKTLKTMKTSKVLDNLGKCVGDIR